MPSTMTAPAAPPADSIGRRSGPSRRSFMAGAAAATTVVTLGSGTQLAFGTPDQPATGDVLVYIFLRGGADGLSIVAPVSYPSYHDLRTDGGTTIAVSQSQALDIGHPVFGLNPAMAPLLPFWNADEMAIVHAVGSPRSLTATRSHFEAEQVWERCGLEATTQTGWIGRHMATSSQTSGNLAALAIEQRIWATLQGYTRSLAVGSIYNFDVFGFSDATAARSALDALHQGTGPLDAQGSQTLAAVNTMDAIDFSALGPRNGAVYPNESFGRELDQVARLIKAGVGLRSVCLDFGGWDHHNEMGPAVAGERTYDRINRFANALQAFLADIGDDTDEVTTLVVSEFGRTINMNGNGGTDHGRGGLAMAFGKGVNGGVYGDFPSVIEDGPEGDLEVMTDFRRIYAELLDRRLGTGANTATVLNGYATPGHLGMFV